MRLDFRVIGLGVAIVAGASLASSVAMADEVQLAGRTGLSAADHGAVAVAEKEEGSVEKQKEKAGAEKKEIKGSDSKGKYFYKKTCKECHGKDGDGGEVTPISKTIKQWERFFKKAKHGDEETLLDVTDEEKLIHIKTFLMNHAADSDQPETCG